MVPEVLVTTTAANARDQTHQIVRLATMAETHMEMERDHDLRVSIITEVVVLTEILYERPEMTVIIPIEYPEIPMSQHLELFLASVLALHLTNGTLHLVTDVTYLEKCASRYIA